MEDDRKYLLMAEINQSFTPGSPIDSRALFAGRKRQREKLMNAIFQKGEHAILFGERGVGKTSLTNILLDFPLAMGKFDYQRAKINCSESMTFEAIWRSIFRQLIIDQDDNGPSTLEEALPRDPNSENIRETFQLLSDRSSRSSIVIIDELDKVVSRTIQCQLADTIKTLSDNAIDTTLIMVGVGRSIDQLIGEHRSIDRAIVQIPMTRMVRSELLEILEHGLARCEGMTIESSPRDRIVDYSQGLPFYTHLLARESALQAIRSDRTYITTQDLEYAVRETVNSQLETNLSTYNTIVPAPRGKTFRPRLASLRSG